MVGALQAQRALQFTLGDAGHFAFHQLHARAVELTNDPQAACGVPASMEMRVRAVARQARSWCGPCVDWEVVMAGDVRAELRRAVERMQVACQHENETLYAMALTEVETALAALPAALRNTAQARWNWPMRAAQVLSATARLTLTHVVSVAKGARDWRQRRAASEALAR
jgi:hypothetical protein